jgi:glutathione S-transferase
MLEVWGRATSINVQKVMWAIGELDLPVTRIDAGGPYGGLDTPEYGAMNPNRRIPTLRDGDVVLWESNVIVRYLAATFGDGRLQPRDPVERAVADQWMDWQQTTLLADMRTVFWGLVRTPAEQRDRRKIDTAVEDLKEIWARLDRHLSGRRWVADERFTMGDIPVGAMCHRYHALGVPRAALPHLAVWYERLTTRDAFREHVMIPLA